MFKIMFNKEVIDTAETMAEAIALCNEYAIAFRGQSGRVYVQ